MLHLFSLSPQGVPKVVSLLECSSLLELDDAGMVILVSGREAWERLVRAGGGLTLCDQRRCNYDSLKQAFLGTASGKLLVAKLVELIGFFGRIVRQHEDVARAEVEMATSRFHSWHLVSHGGIPCLVFTFASFDQHSQDWVFSPKKSFCDLSLEEQTSFIEGKHTEHFGQDVAAFDATHTNEVLGQLTQLKQMLENAPSIQTAKLLYTAAVQIKTELLQ